MAYWQITLAFLLAGLLVDIPYRFIKFSFILADGYSPEQIKKSRIPMSQKEKRMRLRLIVEVTTAFVLYFAVLPATEAFWIPIGSVAILAVSTVVFRSMLIRKRSMNPNNSIKSINIQG